jgi:hypothetical protein
MPASPKPGPGRLAGWVDPRPGGGGHDRLTPAGRGGYDQASPCRDGEAAVFSRYMFLPTRLL